MYEKLQDFYTSEGSERVGFVLDDGTIVEVANIAENPKEGFDVSVEDMAEHFDREIARWHTHPGGSANLSVGDYSSFLNWPRVDHIIIGKEGIRVYRVRNGQVING